MELIPYYQYRRTMGIFNPIDNEEEYYFVCTWNGLDSDIINYANINYLQIKYPNMELLKYNLEGEEYHQILVTKIPSDSEEKEDILKSSHHEIVSEEHFQELSKIILENHFNLWGKELVKKEYFNKEDPSEEELLEKFSKVADIESKLILTKKDLALF